MWENETSSDTIDMARELRQRIERLYLVALQASGEERSALLQRSEPEVRRAVEDLLARDVSDRLPPQDPDTATVTVPARKQFALEPGDQIGKRFRIVRVIGKGGMGEVYEAEDRDLGVIVALKILRPELLERAEFLSRFRREVQLARQVTHPNICRVFDLGSDTVNGIPVVFLTMEFLAGETLSDHLRRTGPLHDAALPLMQNMLEALGALHERGIVHRDFKPGNVMVVRSATGAERAVVTDFGLARELEREASDPLTRVNHVVGTPEYMAPEQFHGHPATPQSDLYSLGLVMYEAVTGMRPFPEGAGMSARRLPAPPSTYRDGVGPRLDAAIMSCLAPDPKDRPQSAGEVLRVLGAPAVVSERRNRIAALRLAAFGALLALLIAVAASTGLFREVLPFGTQVTEKKLVAILPFKAVDEDRELRALSDGMAEVLTSQLSQLEQLQGSFSVVPASEIRSRKIDSVDQAHKQYGVNLAITGSIQRQGAGSMLFTANIVDAVNMRQIRATTFDVGLSDLKALREGVTRQVIGLLEVQTTTQSDEALAMKETARAAAYFAYLEGRGYLHRFDVAGNIDRGIESLEKALKEDPGYVLAHAALGEAYWRKALATNDKAWGDRAVASARKAVQLGGSLALPHVKLGEIYAQRARPREAIREFQFALESQPASADAYRGLGRAYSSIGLNRDAENAYVHAVRLRPNDWYAHNLLGVFYYGLGKYDQAGQAWIKARDLTPDNEYPYRNLGMVYLATGKFDEARAQFEKSNAIKPSFLAHLGLGRLSYYADRPADAIVEYETATEIEPNNHLGWGGLGDAYGQMPGRENEAKAAYAKAILSCERRLALAPGEEEILAFLARYHARSGQKAKALEILSRLADAQTLRPNTRYEIALTHEVIGERRLAVKEFASLLKDQRSATQIRSDPALRQLNRDPEFVALLRR